MTRRGRMLEALGQQVWVHGNTAQREYASLHEEKKEKQ
jgi:hypothetical protein